MSNSRPSKALERQKFGPYGNNFLSQLVKHWEESANMFNNKCKVTQLRTGIVLSKKGGALVKMMLPCRFGFGAKFGSGKQVIPFIALHDLVRMYLCVIEHQISGPINAIASNISNEDFTKELKKATNSFSLVPSIPAFIFKALLGEMSEALLKGVAVLNKLMKENGFVFYFNCLEEVLKGE